MNVFITGISRGIGLGLARQALKAGHNVFGLARKPEESVELQQLLKEFSERLKVIALDLSSAEAPARLKAATADIIQLDLLINNAGVYQQGASREDFMQSYLVNSYVPYMVTETMLEKLQKGSEPKVIHLSSMMGSVEDNTSGGAYAYRSSKSALNMISKSLSVDFPWLTSVVVHPGWVKTRMGGESAPVSVEESSSGLWQVIEKASRNDSGSFKDFNGRSLPW